MTLWICEHCGQVRECDTPLVCARTVYHADLLPMVELAGATARGWLDPNSSHPVAGKTSTDPGYSWLADLGPDSVVSAG